ncbi:MAG: hypothetical protein EOM50_24000 [Erysipelotrichia bacterium]|nr:hypothetical protein [Erysipelotrichia bacterium]
MTNLFYELGIAVKIVPTRWTSYSEALKTLANLKKLKGDNVTHYKIIAEVTKAILIIESNDCSFIMFNNVMAALK